MDGVLRMAWFVVRRSGAGSIVAHDALPLQWGEQAWRACFAALLSLSNHVLPALLAKIDGAVRDGRGTVKISGSDRPRREFLHVNDPADAVILLMKTWSEEGPINGGRARMHHSLSSRADVIGFKGG